MNGKVNTDLCVLNLFSMVSAFTAYIYSLKRASYFPNYIRPD